MHQKSSTSNTPFKTENNKENEILNILNAQKTPFKDKNDCGVVLTEEASVNYEEVEEDGEKSNDETIKVKEDNFKMDSNREKSNNNSNNNTLSSNDISTELTESQIDHLVNSTNTDSESDRNSTINSGQMLSLSDASDEQITDNNESYSPSQERNSKPC